MSDRFHMPDNSLDTAPDSYEEEKRRSISLDMARSALTDYYLSSDVIERADYLEHSERTIELMHAFAGDLLPELAYHAGLLHDLPQRQSSDHAGVSEAAEAALSGYFYQSDLSDKEQKYVSGLLAHMEVVGLAAKTYRRKFAKAGPSDDLSCWPIRSARSRSTIPWARWSGVSRDSRIETDSPICRAASE